MSKKRKKSRNKKSKVTARRSSSTARASTKTGSSITPQAQIDPAQIEAAPLAETSFGDDLLEKCRTRWQYGNWDDLIALTQDDITHAAGRDKVAMLVAAGHAQTGDMARARHFANLAMGWGVSRDIAARVLIGSAHNSLACAAAALDLSDDAETHFHDSVSLVEPRADGTLLAHNRRFRETARLGLFSEASSLLELELRGLNRPDVSENPDLQTKTLAENLAWLRRKAGSNIAALPDSAPLTYVPLATPPSDVLEAPRFNMDAFNYYREKNSGFLYLDVKSLPRSGLHYTKTCLEDVAGKNFSFCEWYSEPGCCKQMPCALTGFDKPSEFGIRMIKSHDFDMNDPAFPTGTAVRRLVLLRDPLLILTSWWALDVLRANDEMLSRHGIDMQKINYLHERAVVSSAHDLVARHGQASVVQTLPEWLDDKVTYISRFIEKWGRDKGAILANYMDLPQILPDLLLPWRRFMPTEMEERLAHFVQHAASDFRPRYTPWVGPNDTYSAYLETHAAMFEEAAEKIRRNDTRQLLPNEG
ncbi:hypothetical protein Q4577_18920 [Marinovum sp. 2_MG-2023]|uniref:hypothetical protein n=1 Tax=unclassified Marinovum TaxID=2647166 RepID=UPI0026E44C8E|nr:MULTISPECIES: hypothetical protein [unclassified Marinovum]MDO6732111.1 hypothetical protein [Marinovum sp. 2_MG-2023]MDO6781426.1 hypothetical protein [Marinovum sp. 1_MG-2023]